MPISENWQLSNRQSERTMVPTALRPTVTGQRKSSGSSLSPNRRKLVPSRGKTMAGPSIWHSMNHHRRRRFGPSPCSRTKPGSQMLWFLATGRSPTMVPNWLPSVDALHEAPLCLCAVVVAQACPVQQVGPPLSQLCKGPDRDVSLRELQPRAYEVFHSQSPVHLSNGRLRPSFAQDVADHGRLERRQAGGRFGFNR